MPLQEKDFKNLPEATVIVCELDPLKDEGKQYAEKLQNAGVTVTLLEVQELFMLLISFLPALRNILSTTGQIIKTYFNSEIMKRIVVINGHPAQESFNTAIAESYISSGVASGAEVRYVAIGQLNFNPNLQSGYQQRMELEPDLIKALEDIQWSEHQVWIHPVWWLGMPAIMKGFFDKAFLPGIAFKSNKKGNSEGLLNAKSARIITTAGDLSLKVYEEEYHSSGLIQLKKGF